MIAEAIRGTLLPDSETGIAPPEREASATLRVALRVADVLGADNPRPAACKPDTNHPVPTRPASRRSFFVRCASLWG
jgi:hypothetical protein